MPTHGEALVVLQREKVSSFVLLCHARNGSSFLSSLCPACPQLHTTLHSANGNHKCKDKFISYFSELMAYLSNKYKKESDVDRVMERWRSEIDLLFSLAFN